MLSLFSRIAVLAGDGALHGGQAPYRAPCPASRCARLRDFKGMRACLAAAHTGIRRVLGGAA